MSVDAVKPVEETPVPKAGPEQAPEISAPKATETPAVAEPTVAAAVTSDDTAPAPATENPTTDNTTIVAATPASEGVLGYKEHGFLKSLRYSKHYFWFREEASTAESLTHITKSDKTEAAHHSSAWAQETGNGVLFYAKRAEDKATPAGLIGLAEASTVLKEGTAEFSFTVGKIHHRFQANTSTERDSWIVALEKKIEEAKGLKDEITGRDSYKKTIEGFAVVSPTIAAARASSRGPKKTVDAAAPAVVASEAPANVEAVSESTADADKKAKLDAEKNAKKERSQSRKRTSIFGMLGKKDEEKDAKKEEKKAEKEQLKEEKKAEAEQKKEEAKATHDSKKAVEAAEAAAVAAVPAAIIVAAEKKEDKKDEEVTTPTEKKNKRASVFGSFFSKKAVTSPSAEKTENEAIGPIVPVKETEVAPVSETAPKLDEPVETKPIDAAAVTAPVDTVETPAAAPAAAEEPVKETIAEPSTEAAAAPKNEKKTGFLAGLMKKAEGKKEEKKEEKAAEEIAKDPVAAAAVPASDAVTETSAEAPVAEATDAKEERPAREKRRTSFFSSALGTIKKRNADSETATETEGAVTEVKREKSPLPKLGGLFRKPSKAVKPTEAPKPVDATAENDAAAVATTETTVPATTIAAEPTESKIVGDVVPDELHASVHEAVTTAPAEAKTTA